MDNTSKYYKRHAKEDPILERFYASKGIVKLTPLRHIKDIPKERRIELINQFLNLNS